MGVGPENAPAAWDPLSQTLALPSLSVHSNELAREARLRAPAEPRISADTRATAVSWMVEVASGMRLQQETLHQAVSHFDRFLAGTEVRD